MKKISEKSKKLEEFMIYFKLFRLYKSYLLLISDREEMGIGNVSLGIPQILDGIKSSSTSYSYFGIKQRLLSRLIVEKSSNALKAPVLLLLFLNGKRKEENVIKPIIEMLNETLNDLK